MVGALIGALVVAAAWVIKLLCDEIQGTAIVRKRELSQLRKQNIQHQHAHDAYKNAYEELCKKYTELLDKYEKLCYKTERGE